MKNRILSFFLAAVMLVGLVPVLANADAVKATETVAGSSIVWKYLDDNTDPAGADNALTGDARLTWTAIDYDDSAWKSAQGPFGSKRGSTAVDTGYTANTLLAGNDGANNYMAYFFRTELEIESAEDVISIDGAVSYDDSMVLYINGTPVVSGGNTDYTYNLEYCGSGTSPIASKSFSITDTSMLVDGTNVIAVELHQDGAISSDSWFDLSSLKITTNELAYSNISVNIGAFYNEMNFVWHFNDSAAGTLYVAKTADLVDGEMPENALTFTAKATKAKNGIDYYNKVTAKGLLENTEYSYQIVTGDVKSDIYTFTTGAPVGAFSFIFAGDPQVGQTSVAVDQPLWASSLEKIDDSVIFDDASFMLVSGDHVNYAGTEAHYDAYLDHEFLYNTPTVDVIGNHDSFNNVWADKNSIFYEHFILPNEGSKGGNVTADAGGDSWLVYNNVLFINLNTNDTNNATHIAFMEEAIAANPDVSWKVVMFHHSVYSVGYHSADDPIVNLRNALVPAIAELDIDVVLMGHDHVYCRTYMMDGLNPMTDASIYDDANYSSITDPEGILYVTANSASGTKYYSVLDTINPYAAVQNQERIPNISKVYVSDTQFAITTYRLTDMSVVDTFAINRKETAVDSDVVKVKILINAIGEVNRDAIPRIEAARAAYDALTDEQKAQITNYDVLLAAEAADFDVADVVTLINNIGKLDASSAAKVEEARAAYDALSDEQKANVTNYDVLLEAEAALAAAFDPTVIVTSGYDAEIGLVYPESEGYFHVSGRDYNNEGALYQDLTAGKYTDGTSYTISFKARTLPYIKSKLPLTNNTSLIVADRPAKIRIESTDGTRTYFSSVLLTPEWTEYSATTTVLNGTIYFSGSGAACGFAPFDIKGLRIVETETGKDVTLNASGAYDGVAGWSAKVGGGSLRTLEFTYIENDNGYLSVPKSSDVNTAFTFSSNETLAAGKYTVSGDFRLNVIDYNKYDASAATLAADGNVANLTVSMDADTTAEIDVENWTTATFTIDSTEAFNKNDIVFTLDEALELGVKNLEITLVEEYIPEPEIFDISGVTMTLGSSLSLDFAVDTAKLTGTDNYAQMTIVYADGRESDTVIVPQSEWTQYNGTVYTAKFTGMAAKQMNDVVTAVIYNADGVAVSNPKSDSIETYAVRMLNGDAASNAKLRAVYVDMLNYGAAAQEQFDYDVENLANRNLTETHKAWATTTVETVDNRVKGTGYAGSTLTLAGEIQLDLVFNNSAVGKDYSTLYAIATYTDHYGHAKEVRVEGTDFIKYGSTMCQVSVTGMAVADFRSVVSCTVYNADGAAVANAADSVESYANRNAESLGATVDTIVKFGASSYNYFH